MAEQHPGSPEVNDQGSSTAGSQSSMRPQPQQPNIQEPRQGRSRITTILSLLLAVVFVGAVLGGAKILVDRNVYTDVAMGPVDAPDADAPACTNIIGALPNRTADYRLVDLTDPAPAGAAAYRDSGGTELTVRCGVSIPGQFTTVSTLISRGGTEWLRVDDATIGSDLSTWYSLGSSPVVAVTGSVRSGSSLDQVIDIDSIGNAISRNTSDDAPEPRALPLTALKSASGSAASTSSNTAKTCTAFTDALPETFGSYRRITETTVSSSDTPAGTPIDSLENMVVWTAPGIEPVVLRCGVAMSPNYAAGAQLTQIDEVPWFEDAALASGSTAGVWYALGYSGTVAVSLPLDAGDSVLPQLSRIIASTMTKTGS